MPFFVYFGLKSVTFYEILKTKFKVTSFDAYCYLLSGFIANG